MYSEYGEDCGVTKLVKGPPMITADKNLEKRSLEMRINLQSRLLRVSSLPNYESVVQANKPDWIDPNKSYRLLLSCLLSKNKMTIVKLAKV